MKGLFIILLLYFYTNTYAQTKILAGYTFDQGNYVLYTTSNTSNFRNPKDILDSLGRWYIDENEVVKKVSMDWELKEKKDFDLYKANYDFEIYLFKDKIKVETFYVNKENSTLYHKNKAYFFSMDYLRMIYSKTKVESIKEMRTFSPIDSIGIYHPEIYDSALAYYNKCLTNDSVLFIMRTNLLHAATEGYFEFKYPIKKSDMQLSIEEITSHVKNNIRTKYKTDKFNIEFLWFDKGQMHFNILCNKELYDRFSLYSKEKSPYDDDFWSPLPFSVATFPKDQTWRF